MIATVMSLLLVMRNLVGPVMRSAAAYGGPVSMCIVGSHFIFLLVVKMVFYRHHFHGKKGGDSGGGGDSDGGGGYDADDGIDADDVMR